MNEEALNDAYTLFTETGYNGTVDEFSNLIETNPEALKDAHKLFVETGYNGSVDEFSALVKKKDQPQQDSTSPVEPTDAVTGDQTRDGVSESSTPTTDELIGDKEETPYEPKFKPEEEAGSRYAQAGDPILPQVISSLSKNIENKKTELESAQADIVTTSYGGMAEGVRPRDPAKIARLQKEIDAQSKFLRKQEQKKAEIDSQYASELLGQGEGSSDIRSMIETEQSLEGDIYDFMSRSFAPFVRALTPVSGFQTEAEVKLATKKALERQISDEIQKEAVAISDKSSSYDERKIENIDKFNSLAEQLAVEVESGQIDFPTYEGAYGALLEDYTKKDAELLAERDAFAKNRDIYMKSLEDLSIVNEYDDLSSFESGVKSFENEWIKTPRQVAGLLKATSLITSLAPAPVAGIPFKVRQEIYLDAIEPVTDYLSALTEENLFKVDPDESAANFIGEVGGQLSKIIPAAAAAPIAGVTVSAGMAFDEMHESVKDVEGISREEAVNMAAIYTPIGTLFEYAGARTGINAVNKKFAMDTAKKIILDQGLTKLGKKEATIALKNSLFKELKLNVTQEFFEEGITEALQTSVQEGIRQLKNVQRGETLFEFDGGEFLNEVGTAFVLGGIAGGAVGGISTMIGTSGKSKTGFEIYRETLLNDDIYNKMYRKIEASKIPQEQKDKALAVMKRDAETLRSVAGIGLSVENQRKAAELITRKSVLEAAIEGKDKSLVKDITNQITAIDEQLSQFKPTVEETTQSAVQQDIQEQVEVIADEMDSETETKQPSEVNVKPDETAQEVRVEADQKTKEQKAAEVESNDNKRSDEILSGKEAVTKVLDTPVTEFNNIAIEEAQEAYDQAETAKQEVEKSNISRPRKKELIDLLNELQTEIKSNETKFKTKDSVKQTTKTTKVTSIRATERKTEKAKPIKTVRDAVDKEVVYNGQKGRLRIGEDKAILFEASDGTLTEVPAGSKNQSINLSTLGMKPYTAPKLTAGKVVIDGKDSGQLVSVNKDGDGNVVSYTVKRDGQDRTIRDADGALDLAIQQQQEALGTVPDIELTRFEQIFTETIEEVVSEAGVIKTMPSAPKPKTPTTTKPKQTTKTDGKEKRPVLENAQTSRDKAEGRKDSPELRTEKEKVTTPKKQTNVQTKKAETKAEEVTKAEQKQKAFDSIDKIAEELKKRLAIKGIEGIDVQKQGISQNDIIDLAAKAAKALAATGIEIDAAVKRVLAELKDMGVLRDSDPVEVALAVQSELNKDAAKTKPETSYKELTSEEDTIGEEADKRVTGLRNSLLPDGIVDKVRSVTDNLKRTAQGVLDSGKAAVESGLIRPMRVVQEVLMNPRQLTVDESAALIYHKLKLLNEIDVLTETLNNPKTDPAKFSSARLLLADKLSDLQNLNSSTKIAGMLNAQSLWIRGLLVDAEYNLQTQIGIMKAYTGRDTIDPEVMERLKGYDKKIKELKETIREKEAENAELKQSLAIPKAPKSKTAAQKGRDIAERVRGLKRNRTYASLSKLQSTPEAIFTVAWDGSLELLAQTFKATGSAITAVEAAIKNLKESKWYKGLKNKDTADEIINGLYADNGIKLPNVSEEGVLSIPESFLKEIIAAGFDTIEAATRKTQEVLFELGIEADERVVRDAISNYGKQSKLSKNEIDKKLREIKRMGKLTSALEDVMKKKRPMKSGRERDALTEKERNIRRQINELLKDIPQTDAEIERQWKTSYEGLVKRLQNRVEDLKRQIAAGKKDPKKRDVQTGPEIDALKAEIKELNETLNALDNTETKKMTWEKRHRLLEGSLLSRIEEEQRRIDQKDFVGAEKLDPVTSPRITELREKLKAKKEERAALEKKFAPEIQEKKNESIKLKALDRAAKKLEGQLRGEIELEAKKQGKQTVTPLIEAAEQKVKILREALKESDQYKELALKRKLKNAKAAAQKSIDRYKQRIKDKDFIPLKREEVLDAELRKLRAEQRREMQRFELEKHRWALNQRGKLELISDSFMEVFNLPRALMASLDLSAPLRQGLVLSAANPRLAARAFKEMLLQAGSKDRYETWLYDLQGTEDYQTAKSLGLYISMPNAQLLAREEMFVSSLAENVPLGYGKLVGASNRAYSSYLNVLRWGVWTEMTQQMEALGLDPVKNKNDYRGMARFINSATGRGQLFTDGLLGQSGQSSERTLNALFFAPRYVVSRFNLLNPLYYYRLPKSMRKELLRTMFSFLAAQGLFMGLARLAGAEIEPDPRSTDFGKIRFGNIRFDTMAGLQQPLRLAATFITGEKKSLRTGEVNQLNTGEFMSRTRYDEVETFVRSKFSPVASAMSDFAKGTRGKTKDMSFAGLSWEEQVMFKNVVGDDLTLSERTAGLIMPLYLSDMKEIIEGEGAVTGAGVFLPALLGFGMQYFDPMGEDGGGEIDTDSIDFDIDAETIDTNMDFKLDTKIKTMNQSLSKPIKVDKVKLDKVKSD